MIALGQHIENYIDKLSIVLKQEVQFQIETLCQALYHAWREGRCIYLCGNGGSAGNAIHLANDFLYGAGIKNGKGLRVEALSANPSVLTCLANDLGYEHIYSEQLKVKAGRGDVLIVLSGSGNSPNVVKALEVGKALGMRTFAILGFSGGRCKALADVFIHFEVNDMQIAEDIQLIVGHICMQWLSKQNLLERKEHRVLSCEYETTS